MDLKILNLNDVGSKDVAIVGGKGADLGELMNNGFPVPPGFVVSAHACEIFFKTIDLDRKFTALNHANAFQGQSASPGVYEGIAHVILDPSIDIELKPGEILVAPYTESCYSSQAPVFPFSSSARFLESLISGTR